MDSLSLTLAIGPVLLKAAKLATLCRDIQNKVPSCPSTFKLVITECIGVHEILEIYQTLGRQDTSELSIAGVIENLPDGLDRVLESIQKHVQDIEPSGKARTDQENKSDVNGKDIEWNEEQVQLLLEELRHYRCNLEAYLKPLPSIGEAENNDAQPQEKTKLDLPTIVEPPVDDPSQEPQLNPSRFSIDSISTQDFAVNPNRFSTDSITSTLSATNFEFDAEALSSSSYRQAFTERVRNIISRPLNSPGDDALLRAVEPLEGEKHYYEQSIDIEWEPTISGSTIRSEYTDSITSANTLQSTRSRLSNLTIERITTRRIRNIGNPTDVVHVTHIDLDPVTGEFTGLPPKWRSILLAEDERARAAAAVAASATNPVPEASTPAISRTIDIKTATTIKLVVVGDSGKLKQGLLTTYVNNKAPTEYIPQVFDNYAVTIMIGDDPYTLGLFDTAGQESYDRLRPLSYPQTDVFMIVISVSNRTHYTNARDVWAPELKHHCPGIPFLLVGIKDGERYQAEQEDRVLGGFGQMKENSSEGRRLAREIGAEKYVECELRSMKGVKDVFDEAIVASLEPVVVPKKKKRLSRLRLLSRIEED